MAENCNSMRLLKIMSDIDERYIEQAAPRHRSRIISIIRVWPAALLAAALVTIPIGAAFGTDPLSKFYDWLANPTPDVDQKEVANGVDAWIYDEYSKIPEDELNKLKSMSRKQLEREVNGFAEKYKVGQSFSKEDQDKLIFLIVNYGDSPEAQAYMSSKSSVTKGWRSVADPRAATAVTTA